MFVEQILDIDRKLDLATKFEKARSVEPGEGWQHHGIADRGKAVRLVIHPQTGAKARREIVAAPQRGLELGHQSDFPAGRGGGGRRADFGLLEGEPARQRQAAMGSPWTVSSTPLLRCWPVSIVWSVTGSVARVLVRSSR